MGLEQQALRYHLDPLRFLYRDRLMVLHQDHLRVNPSVFYSELAHFFGLADPFPHETEFVKVNSRGRLGTDLCDNATLSRALRRKLEPEYLAQEHMLQQYGMPVPKDLRLRQTRCDKLWKATETDMPVC